MLWNPWHGCKKYSEGCMHCYVYRTDGKHDRDASEIKKNKDFDLPVRRKKNGEYVLNGSEIVYTCFTSDFFLDTADEWRKEAWQIINERSDLDFLIVTKRIERFYVSLPEDWHDGYENVTICTTVENSRRCTERLPFFNKLPIKHKQIVCEPLLERIDLSPYLNSSIEGVVAGGESGNQARPCRYEWILDIRNQCIQANVPFYFKQTGARFIKDGKEFRIERKNQHSQARKAGIDYYPDKNKL